MLKTGPQALGGLLWMAFVLLPPCLQAGAQAAPSDPASPASLHVITDPAAYRAEARRDPSRRMVDLRSAVPGLVFDLRYATANNFLRRPLYESFGAFARAATAARLREVEADLKAQGLGLKIFDAYRPYSATVRMWNLGGPWHLFLAPPTLGSDHNRGVAVDVSLVDLATGREVAMPTDFDAFGPRTGHSYANLPAPVLANRALLRRVMERNGFRSLDVEWWHYCLHGSKDYSLLDLPFSAFADESAK